MPIARDERGSGAREHDRGGAIVESVNGTLRNGDAPGNGGRVAVARDVHVGLQHAFGILRRMEQTRERSDIGTRDARVEGVVCAFWVGSHARHATVERSYRGAGEHVAVAQGQGVAREAQARRRCERERAEFGIGGTHAACGNATLYERRSHRAADARDRAHGARLDRQSRAAQRRKIDVARGDVEHPAVPETALRDDILARNPRARGRRRRPPCRGCRRYPRAHRPQRRQRSHSQNAHSRFARSLASRPRQRCRPAGPRARSLRSSRRSRARAPRANRDSAPAPRPARHPARSRARLYLRSDTPVRRHRTRARRHRA